MRWTKAEDSKLRKHYPRMGLDSSLFLPGRTREACKTRAKVLGLRVEEPKHGSMGKEFRPWSAEELNILRIKYPIMGSRVCELLPGRTQGACHQQASDLGIAQRQTFWTEEELAQLQEDKESTCVTLAATSKRSARAIACQSYRKGVPRQLGRLDGVSRATPRWTEEELEVLRTHYPKGAEACLQKLPGRTLSSIHNKARRLHLRVQI